jgi:hypothetical protein
MQIEVDARCISPRRRNAVMQIATLALGGPLIKSSCRHPGESRDPLLLFGFKEDQNGFRLSLGLRRQDAEANIRAANGPKGELRMQRVMTSL